MYPLGTVWYEDADIYFVKMEQANDLGINETDNNSHITISPNPFTSTTTITFSEELFRQAQQPSTIKVMDVLGQTIQQYTINNRQSTIDMSGYAKGIYFVQITDEKKTIVNRKIVVQ
jgi:hypothetical protein